MILITILFVSSLTDRRYLIVPLKIVKVWFSIGKFQEEVKFKEKMNIESILRKLILPQERHDARAAELINA